MLIFDQIKLVYLANPKTGTTSFEHAFARYANRKQSRILTKHVPFRRFKKTFPKLAREYEIVTCVRDPLETLHSWYRYRSRPILRGNPNSTHGLSFEEFFHEWCKEKPAKFAHVHASVGFVLGRGGNIVRKLSIFKYQSNPDPVEYVAAKLGVSAPASQRNVSPRQAATNGELLKIHAGSDCPKLAEQYALYNKIRFVNAKK